MKLLKVFSGLLLLASACPAVAGSGSGVPTTVIVQNGVVVFITPSHTGAPSCATTGRWAFNAATAAGQAMMSAFMTAYALQKALTISGTGDCQAWADSEAIAYFAIN